jgi:uncharacterized protein (TIGR02001 family)
MKFKKIIVTTVATTLFLGGAALSASAEEEMPSADLSVSLLSKYVWRGYELSNDSIVIQPSMSVGYKGFGFNLWGNLDTDQDEELFGTDGGNWNETDMTLSYDGSAGMVGYSLGYIYYGLDGATDSQELYAAVSFDTIAAPSLTIYRDFDAYEGWYVNLAVGHSFAVTEAISLDIGGHVSYLMADDAETLADPSDPTDEYADFHDGVLAVSATIPLSELISVTPELYYSFPLGSDADEIIDDHIYGGVTLSMAF